MSLLFRTTLKSGGKRLINLLQVSAFDLKENKIYFHHSYQKTSIFGNFFIFGGGGNKIETIIYENKKEAEKDFNDIQNSLNKYYISLSQSQIKNYNLCQCELISGVNSK